MVAVELIRHLQLEADELRKQRKRQNVTGLHKSVQRMICLRWGKCFERSSLVNCRLESREDVFGSNVCVEDT